MTEVSKEADKEKLEKPQKTSKGFPNKVVIRKLPPTLTAQEFQEIVSPLPEILDFYFVKGDFSLGIEATSRAYIEFKNEEDVSARSSGEVSKN